MADHKLVLYGSHVSTCTNSVKAFFRANKIDYEFKSVNIFAGENKTEEYTKLNPQQKVPVLVDGDLVLRESLVFLRYIANSRQGIADHWYPKDPKKRALVDLGIEYWAQNSGRFFAIAGHQFGSKTHATKEDAIAAVNAAITEFENMFLKSHKFVAGDQPSIADLHFVYYLQGQSFFTGHKYDDHKRLLQYYDDIYACEPALKEQVEEYQNNVKLAFPSK